MGLFGKIFNSGSKKDATSQDSSAVSGASPPTRPPRTQALSDAYRKHQEAFEHAKAAELRKLDESAEKVTRARTGSIIFRLDNAILHSAKGNAVFKAHEDDAPLTPPVELAEILRSPQMRNAFRIYLKKKFAGESLAFFETIETFKRVQQDEWRRIMAEGMLENFILEQAQFPVNISATDKSELLARMTANYWPSNSFDAVQREMYDLMSSNHFSAFCRIYWPGGVLLAVPGGPFCHENLIHDRAAGSTASFDEMGSNSTSATDRNL